MCLHLWIVKASQKDYPLVILFMYFIMAAIHVCAFNVTVMYFINSLLFFFFFLLVTYPVKWLISDLELHDEGLVFLLLCLSHTIVSLFQAYLTFSPLSHFASTYSDWIHVVHIHLVYLCLLKEPIFHKTASDTPSYIWLLCPLRFSWSFITNWLALHLFVRMSYHLYLEDEYRITHPLHSLNKNVHLYNKNLPWGFSRNRH